MAFIMSQIGVSHKKVNAYTTSQSEVCMDLNSGKILYKYNEKEKLPMASTTKILTAITVIENVDLSSVVDIDDKCVNIEGSSIYLKIGEKITVLELLYGLMLRSGNDCAVALANFVSGNIKDFALLMNETAIKIGCQNSSFKNPHGLPQKEHYTTAEDLAMITKYAMENKTFKKIVSTQKITICKDDENSKRTLINKNKTLYRYSGATGVKTGYTKEAGRCLVSSASKDGLDVVCVVLNSPQMFERSFELLDYCFDHYDSNIIASVRDFNNYNELEGFGVYINSDLKLTKKSEENFDYKVKIIYKTLELPIKRNEQIAEISIYSQNQLLYSQKIYTLIDVNNKEHLRLIVDKLNAYERCINENKQIFG